MREKRLFRVGSAATKRAQEASEYKLIEVKCNLNMACVRRGPMGIVSDLLKELAVEKFERRLHLATLRQPPCAQMTHRPTCSPAHAVARVCACSAKRERQRLSLCAEGGTYRSVASHLRAAWHAGSLRAGNSRTVALHTLDRFTTVNAAGNVRRPCPLVWQGARAPARQQTTASVPFGTSSLRKTPPRRAHVLAVLAAVAPARALDHAREGQRALVEARAG
eukprot:6207366-Pleurochrysis_carterae.AAC.1